MQAVASSLTSHALRALEIGTTQYYATGFVASTSFFGYHIAKRMCSDRGGLPPADYIILALPCVLIVTVCGPYLAPAVACAAYGCRKAS